MFTVEKYAGEFAFRIHSNDGWHTDLTADETIGAAARFMFLGPRSFWGLKGCSDAEWSWEFEEVGLYDWCIQDAQGRFLGHLTKDEALGCLASMIFAKRPMFGGLRSYEEYVSTFPWARKVKIKALIPVVV